MKCGSWTFQGCLWRADPTLALQAQVPRGAELHAGVHQAVPAGQPGRAEKAAPTQEGHPPQLPAALDRGQLAARLVLPDGR